MRFVIQRMYANSHTGAEAGGVYVISHTHDVCEFSYKGARQKLLYVISHTHDVCDFSYTKVCMRILIQGSKAETFVCDFSYT